MLESVACELPVLIPKYSCQGALNQFVNFCKPFENLHTIRHKKTPRTVDYNFIEVIKVVKTSFFCLKNKSLLSRELQINFKSIYLYFNFKLKD